MSDRAQLDKILTEVNELEDRDKIVLFHQIEDMLNNAAGDDSEDAPVDSVFGLWKDRDITLEKIRQKAWRQKLPSW